MTIAKGRIEAMNGQHFPEFGLKKLTRTAGPRTINSSNTQNKSSRIETIYDRHVLISETEHLQNSISDHDLISSMLSDPQPRSLSNSMFHRLQTFILSPASAALWLLGLPDTRYPSSMSTVAAGIISILSQAEPQLIFHFCSLPSVEKPGISKEESGLLSLLYSLITQLIFSLKPQFESDIDLNHDRFGNLDGTMTNWPAALKLFEDLVSLSAPYIICVIDGIEWTDYRRGSVRCAELLATLCKIMKGRENRVFKVFFTTAGTSGTLKDTLNSEDIYQESGTKHTRRNPFQQTGPNMIPLTEL